LYIIIIMKLGKYSFGIGDRFGRQGKAQLAAIIQAKKDDIAVTPVWNKSHREHEIIGTHPKQVRQEADDSVHTLQWQGAYFVDADHVSMKTVDPFLEVSDFFTLDVADFINQPVDAIERDVFVQKNKDCIGTFTLPGLDQTLSITKDDLFCCAHKYLFAVQEAKRLYETILKKKGADHFITEISMDETNTPQTPAELYLILLMIAQEKIPVQTIAPKFSGRFNKGVDYVGDVEKFKEEFEQDVAVIQMAVQSFALPETLKLSVHSGSDKFSIYAPIRKTLKKTGAGIHVKTAGTTWLEEVIGLAEAGGDGLSLAKEIYCEAYKQRDALCQPYATVIDIHESRLPDPDSVKKWNSDTFAAALRHDPNSKQYNPDFRQLIHVAYKIAAQMGDRYLDSLQKHEAVIAKNVTKNLLERHIRSIFPKQVS
jgi:hypothetical protein